MRGSLVGPSPCGLTTLNKNACDDVSHEPRPDDANIFVLILRLLLNEHSSLSSINKLFAFPYVANNITLAFSSFLTWKIIFSKL